MNYSKQREIVYNTLKENVVHPTAEYVYDVLKKDNPNIKTILTGCTAQTYKQHSDFDYSNIDLVLGNSETSK